MRADLRGLDELSRRIQRLARRWPGIVAEESEAAMEDVVQMMESEVQARTPAGVGGAAGLRGSIAGEVSQRYGKTVGTVGTEVEYAEVVEFGRRPDKTPPPVAPIELWVRRKLNVPKKKARGVAFAVAQKIGSDGFEGAHMFEEAFNENRERIMEMLEKIPENVTREAARRGLQ